MADMLVKLYDLPDGWACLSDQTALGIIIRKPCGPENRLVSTWVGDHFGDTWASEADAALANRPVTCYVARQGQGLIGFACYDATALGFFGPSGVAEGCRRRGTGTALLRACLMDMRSKGYGYAIVGGVGPAEFYRKAAGAAEIPDSTSGFYRTLLGSDP
jgi:hypothetical protein